MIVDREIKIFIGYDAVEAVAFHTLVHSLRKHSSTPLSIHPVDLGNLKRFWQRERDPKQSNDFSFSRWLVPWASNYKGWAIWLDCDILCRDDITKLWDLRDNNYTVQVVQQTQLDTPETKFLGRAQTGYLRKNWSSVMLFNNGKCTALTLDYVGQAHGLDLHQFAWAPDNQIGQLPREWNYLVGASERMDNPKLVHWTLGGPWFEGSESHDLEFADEWFAAKKEMLNAGLGK